MNDIGILLMKYRNWFAHNDIHSFPKNDILVLFYFSFYQYKLIYLGTSCFNP
jgi:hypothetical protein